MHTITVFTPTHNRAHLISRLYDSLQRQTYKDFLWLIIDDGSKDNTKEVIDSFRKEGIIDIEYHFIPNGYLHLASKLASELVKTQYIIRIDDDDAFFDYSLSRFMELWDEVNSEGRDDIGEIRALSVSDHGHISGAYQPKIGATPVDTTYLERHFNTRERLENISCWKSVVWKNIFKDDENNWLYDKVTYISDSIYWFRMSRVYKSRYIFEPLRVYFDTPESLIKDISCKSEQQMINDVYSRYVLLNELSDLYLKYPLILFRYLLTYEVYGLKLKLPIKSSIKALKPFACKLMYMFLLPICWGASFFVRTKNQTQYASNS